MTLRSQDGRIESGHYCQACYRNLLLGLPTFQPFPNLFVTLILVALDTLLVCIATAPWFLIGGLTPRFVFAPIVNGVAIGILVGVQMGLLWCVRRKPRPISVIAAARLKNSPRRENLWDCDLDG
jgi:hypothetical protein